MAVSEEQRRALHERLREQLDAETADLVLEVTVRANMELASRTDIQELRAELLLSIAELNGHLSLQIAELARRIAEMDSRFGARKGEVERDLGARIDATNKRLDESNTRLAALEGAIGQLAVVIPKRIYTVVLPTIVSVQLVLFALAQWVIR